ncbi:outer membrane beta-barrel protein [Sphingomonas sp. 37zxx]|uniref:outer membrane beta-barrel protein n=1 Tax=Sphingomonas sp. 37zxx TaxID=1550073 RepID=UPI0018CC7C99|nr:outer membrane beta-barrel protein [Sphingomonas sp. 37zxx]
MAGLTVLALLADTTAMAQETPPSPVGPTSLGTGGLAPPGGQVRDSGAVLLPRGPVLDEIVDGSVELPSSGGARQADSASQQPTTSGQLVPVRLRTASGRGTTVAGRSRPLFDRQGIRTGSFLFLPTVTANVGATSNIFKQPDGSGDAFGEIGATAALRSDLTRHAIDADLAVNSRTYLDNSSEDAVTYAGRIGGRYDISRGDSLSFDVRREHQLIDRGAVGEVLLTREPIRYDFTGVAVGARNTMGRLVVSLDGQIGRFDYKSAETVDGLRLDQDFRDFNFYEARVDVGYTTGAATVFGSIGGELRRFDGDPLINRDSDVVEVIAGIRGETNALWRGQIGIGYLRGQFKDPNVDAISGVALDVSVEYLATELTTFRLGARRRLQNVGSAISAASLVTEVSAGVDHELLRNLIVSGGVGYQFADFIAADGSSDRAVADVTARYLMNQRWRLNANVGVSRRENRQGLIGDFQEVRGTIGVNYGI